MKFRYNLQKHFAITAAVVLAAASSCLATVLSVPQCYQEKNQWCWNAGAQMVLAFKGHSYSQTAIANWAVGGRNIANYLYGSSDASMHGDDEILMHFGSISSSGSAAALSLSALNTEMANSRPVMIRWGWDSGGGHILVIRGTSGNSVYVNDPWPDNGPSINSYSWMCRAGGHTWTHSLQLKGGSSNTYYQRYQSYYKLAVQRYNSARSYLDCAYAYKDYAYAQYYYYMYKGDSSSANAAYNYYMQTAQYYYNLHYSYCSQYYQHYYNLAAQYYYHANSYLDVAYFYYNYANARWYYYMYYNNSSYADYYYNYYMQWAHYYYNYYYGY